MRAIIIAAGRGSRLGPHTDNRPKCMVDVAGRPILHHQLEAFAAHGIHDLHIVRGYLAEQVTAPGAQYYANTDWPQNNILLSLFCARSAMDGPFLSSYSDILFTERAVQTVLASPFDIALTVDRQWRRAYTGRIDHPVAQAELTEADDERVLRVGKQIGPERTVGEFIGLAKYSEQGARRLVETFEELEAQHSPSMDAPFQAAQHFRKAYLTDLFCELIDRGVTIGCAYIDGGWREIDTVQDLLRVREEWPNV